MALHFVSDILLLLLFLFIFNFYALFFHEFISRFYVFLLSVNISWYMSRLHLLNKERKKGLVSLNTIFFIVIGFVVVIVVHIKHTV